MLTKEYSYNRISLIGNTKNNFDVSVHGNCEKIAQQYDVLTHFLITKDPEIIMRVMMAWEKRKYE